MKTFRLFYVESGDFCRILTKDEYLNFISGAVMHNGDIQSFKTIEIDSRLSCSQGARIASKLGFYSKYIRDICLDEKPVDAIIGNMIL